jgi:ATP-binding cassette subfamily B (MDR/TAP) protein 1
MSARIASTYDTDQRQALLFGNLVELLNDTTHSDELTSKIAFYCLMFLVLAFVALLSHSIGKTAFGMVSENLVLRGG